MKRRIPVFLALALVCAVIGFIALHYVYERRAAAVVKDLYDALKLRDEPKISSLANKSAKQQLYKIAVEHGDVQEFKILGSRTKLDGMWEVDVSVTRSKGSTVETAANLGNGLLVSHVGVSEGGN